MKCHIQSSASRSGAVLVVVGLVMSTALAGGMPEGDRAKSDVAAIQQEAASAERDRKGEPPTVETAHVEITTFVAGDPVTPGDRLSVVIDIAPGEGIHIYAPGEHDYRIVRLQLEPNQYLLIHPLAYPRSVEYLFEPLNERVQVYKEPFRLRQELSLVDTAETRRLARQRDAMLAIEGVLEYQACTDTICYPPEEVPLAWSIALRP